MNEALLTLRVEPLPEGEYLATSVGLPGLVAQGRTVSEAVEIARAVARKLLESYQEHGDPLPAGVTPVGDRSVDVGIAVGLP
jgi:predicted RNase H-like HicB family nuclease